MNREILCNADLTDDTQGASVSWFGPSEMNCLALTRDENETSPEMKSK